MSAQRRNTWIGVGVLGTLLLALIVPGFRGGMASLSHPDPVGPTAYSKSAIGHLAFLRLLEKLEIPSSVSESGSGGYVGRNDVLVIAEPRTDAGTLEDVRAMLLGHTVLLVLPKRAGSSDPNRPYWLAEPKLLGDDAILRVLHLADSKAKLLRVASLQNLAGQAEFAGSPVIDHPQLIRSELLTPLLATPEGMLIAEVTTQTGHIVVLSDPDLMANFAIGQGDNAVLAVNLVESLREGRAKVIVDEFSHGFTEKPFHLLGILFQFPFNLVTLQMALAAMLLGWAATGRFGAAQPLAPPLEAGKRSLIDNGARLLAQSGRIAELSDRYFEEMVRDAGRRLRAPRELDVPQLLRWLSQASGAPRAPLTTATPQEIWTWRKELLGESGTHTKPD